MSEKSCLNCYNYIFDGGHGSCKFYGYHLSTEEDLQGYAEQCSQYKQKVPQKDPVNPNHYTQGKIECIDAIESALTPEEFRGFLKGNIFKYMWRHENKNGLQDVKKGEWYYQRLLKVLKDKDETD